MPFMRERFGKRADRIVEFNVFSTKPGNCSSCDTSSRSCVAPCKQCFASATTSIPSAVS